MTIASYVTVQNGLGHMPLVHMPVSVLDPNLMALNLYKFYRCPMYLAIRLFWSQSVCFVKPQFVTVELIHLPGQSSRTARKLQEIVTLSYKTDRQTDIYMHTYTYIHFFILTTRTSRVQDMQIELQQVKN